MRVTRKKNTGSVGRPVTREVVWKSLDKWLSLQGMDRKDLAEEVGVSYYSVRFWLIGLRYPSRDSILAVAQVLAGADADTDKVQEIYREIFLDAPMRQESAMAVN